MAIYWVTLIIAAIVALGWVKVRRQRKSASGSTAR